MLKCQYCNGRANLVYGDVIYPKREDLHKKRYWYCSCGAYVSAQNDGKPLGTLANAETRAWRAAAHMVFDPLWKSGTYNRSQAYKWLAEKMGIPRSKCHIANFNVEQCKLVISCVQPFAPLK